MEERKIPIHDLKRETYCFEEFIVSVLEKKARVERTISKNKQSDSGLSDIFLQDGFPGYTNVPTFAIVKYSNNKDKIHELVELLESKNNAYKYVIITFVDTGTKPNPYYDGKVIVLGVDYIDNLAKNNPYEWWIFSASCSDDNRMVFDPNSNSIHISQISLAGLALNIDIEVQANEKTFGMISAISEKDFKRRIKTDKSPALFIGNGVSFHFGSDSWDDLSESLFDYLKPAHIDNKDEVKKAIGNTNYSVTGMSQYLIDSKKYYNAIYYSIYRKYEESMHLDNTLIRSITKLKEKFPALPLVTYNYDTFVEKDFELKFKTKMNSVHSKVTESKAAEPKIGHLHGLMPLGNPMKHTKLILTQDDYYETYMGSSWTVSKQKDLLTNNTCLFVGSSMSDVFQMSIINQARKSYYSQYSSYPWKCFALLCLGKLEPKDLASVYNYYFNKGISIIVVENFKELPKKLLSLFE